MKITPIKQKNNKCTCKQSEDIDEDWNFFLRYDKYCPEHGYLQREKTLEFNNVNKSSDLLMKQLENIA